MRLARGTSSGASPVAAAYEKPSSRTLGILDPDSALDLADGGLLLRSHECDGVSGQLRTAGAPHPVDVVLRYGGDVEVHYMPQGFDVDPARSDVRGHQHPVLPRLESRERLRALRLRPVSMDALGGDAVSDQELAQPIRAVLGSG